MRGLPLAAATVPTSTGPTTAAALPSMFRKPKYSPARSSGIRRLNIERLSDCTPPCTSPSVQARM